MISRFLWQEELPRGENAAHNEQGIDHNASSLVVQTLAIADVRSQ